MLSGPAMDVEGTGLKEFGLHEISPPSENVKN
ncbi:hypothetical protein LSAT2_006118, partial [Lamellibrachia satsuma]